MSALNTGQLNCLGGRLLRGTRVRWLGTFARDQLPNLDNEKRPFALILNTDPAEQEGTHWLALFAHDRGLELFDSYGLSPSLYGFPDSYRHSSRSIQALGSSVCGHYCLLFLFYRSRGRSFDSTITLLRNKFSDSSAARFVANLASFSNLHQCTGQTCQIKRCSC